MSTVPGPRTWQDAGLLRPATQDPTELEPDEAVAADGYRPQDPRPDLAGTADPADVAEQRAEVPLDEREDYPG